jgi:hypothetical protein
VLSTSVNSNCTRRKAERGRAVVDVRDDAGIVAPHATVTPRGLKLTSRKRRKRSDRPGQQRAGHVRGRLAVAVIAC